MNKKLMDGYKEITISPKIIDIDSWLSEEEIKDIFFVQKNDEHLDSLSNLFSGSKEDSYKKYSNSIQLKKVVKKNGKDINDGEPLGSDDLVYGAGFDGLIHGAKRKRNEPRLRLTRRHNDKSEFRHNDESEFRK